MDHIETRDGVRLAYTDWGSGPPLVFVHGFVVGADLWEYQTAPLATRGFRTIAYDRRGCGASSRPAHGYDVDSFADDLADVLDVLDVRNVTLVAHSMGAVDAVRYLARRGAARVARLVLVAPATPLPFGVPAGAAARDVAEAQCAALERDRARFVRDGAVPFFGLDDAACTVSPELATWAVGLALRASAHATAACVRAYAAADASDDLKAVRVPTLVIAGGADRTAPPDVTAGPTVHLVRDAVLQVYDDAPHGLFVTHRERFNGQLEAYVRMAAAA